jgi:release factor glutamine methyltransferase
VKAEVWLTQATRQLAMAAVSTARLDALVLLEDATSKDRGWLLAHPEFKLPAAQTSELKKLLNRRAQHEPLAYIRGKATFYGCEFVITPHVLVPRPESEAMIDSLKALVDLPLTVRLTDVGTGSGALGITAKLELPKARVELVEIDAEALQTAKTNVDKFTLDVIVTFSDLLTRAKQSSDVLLCNLPYVPDDYPINQAATWEPKLALFGGSDGLDLYRKLFNQVAKLPSKPLYILTEALPEQHYALITIAGQAGYKLLETNDFVQIFRYQ